MDARKSPNNPNPITFWKHTDKGKSSTRFFSLKRDRPEKSIGKTADDAAHNAQAAAHMMLPVITAAGIEMLGDKGGYIPLAPLGIPVTVGGFVLDIVKAPVCLTVATEEAIRAGIMKLASLVFESQSPTQMQIDRLFKSFLIRMRDTATILVALDLEEVDVLNTKLQSGDIEDLVALTLLHTAYASRHYYGGLVLANDTILDRVDCPVEGLELFDRIMKLKSSIQSALKISHMNLIAMGSEEHELKESRIVCEWIRLIKEGHHLYGKDHPDVNQKQLEIVNNIISQIDELKKTAMEALPKSPVDVASQVPRMKK